MNGKLAEYNAIHDSIYQNVVHVQKSKSNW